jgi:hypothetical protein
MVGSSRQPTTDSAVANTRTATEARVMAAHPSMLDRFVADGVQ